MKKITVFLMLLFCGISMNCVYAQRAKVVQKVYKEAKSILKNVKPPKKVPQLPKEEIVKEEKTCSSCKGNGIIVQYNPYTDSFYNTYCPTCNGRGKVYVYVKKECGNKKEASFEKNRNKIITTRKYVNYL